MSSVTLELWLAYRFRHEFINSRLADSVKKEGRKASGMGVNSRAKGPLAD